MAYLQQSSPNDLAEIVEGIDLPTEFLRDPTCWLEARKVEECLRAFENYAVQNLSIDKPLEKVGHAAKDLKSWGVLDSVLCMIEKPNDIFLQPQRFISYFISPAPPIANIKRDIHSVSFDLPISFEEFPFVLTYLRSAIEAVPLFTGAQMAECIWRQNSVSISWSPTQPSLDELSLSERKMAPEVMQNLILTLEKTELALHEKTQELDKIKSENVKAALSQMASVQDIIEKKTQSQALQQQVLRLQDYFTRSQQLITLLVGQDRLNSQIREAMKRVNWDVAQDSFSRVTKEILGSLDETLTLDTEDKAEKSYEQNIKNLRTRDSRQPWLPHN